MRWQRLQAKESGDRRGHSVAGIATVDDMTLAKFLRRPEVGWTDAGHAVSRSRARSATEVAMQVVHDVKYAGYIHRQQQQVERQQRLAEQTHSRRFRLSASSLHLRTEARQKLAQIRPVSLDQASRISGITPADSRC